MSATDRWRYHDTMKKTYVLDTNVRLHDPTAFRHFDDNEVVIPLKVIEEVDQIKGVCSEIAEHAANLP